MVKGGSAFELALLHNIEHNIIEKHRSIRDSFYQEFITTKDISIKNVKDTLKELSKRYKMAIVTTSRRVDFELIHKNSGITNFMDFVLCVEDYKRAKPHPDPYLKGLEKFNSKDFEAIVVEDSQRGLESSKRANIDCIVVKNEFTQKQDFSKADYFINNIEELKKLL
jgi:HAD superfamily hydrolase (TIGR01509 family)